MNLDEMRAIAAKRINAYVEKFGYEEIKNNAEIMQLVDPEGVFDDWFQIPDMCYNKTNKANLKSYSNDIIIFECISRGKFRLLGENYPYTGDVKLAKSKEKVGRWEKGELEYWGDSINLDAK